MVAEQNQSSLQKYKFLNPLFLLLFGEGFLCQRPRLYLCMEEPNGHVIKYATSKARTNGYFESKCRREIILYCSAVVMTRWFYQKWLKMRRCTTPVGFMRFMEKNDEFRSFFTASNNFLFRRLESALSGKPEAILERV